MIKIANCNCSLDDALSVDFFGKNESGPLVRIASKELGIPKREIEFASVLRRSVDARKRSDVHFVIMLLVSLRNEEDERSFVESGKAQWYRDPGPLNIPFVEDCPHRPLVVGLGPAGLFAALLLAKAGLRPLVIERGACVEKRQKAVREFDAGGSLDVNSNIQFGEGGAGTFSDGKLTTGTKNSMAPHVLRWFCQSGAPKEIMIDAKPHIGSDILPDVVRDMRQKIIDHGGEILFETKLVDIELVKGRLARALLEDPLGNRSWVDAEAMVLACGHSARDTFEMLYGHGIMMEQKPFSMGVRIEHRQADIDDSQYGRFASHPALGASEYKMAVHVSKTRSAYTFCMCPGGEVVCAASEEGGIVTNGMSNHARNGRNSNAALLVNVDPSDFGGDHPLDGMRLQREVEQRAFCATEERGLYRAPAQTVGDFLSGASGTGSSTVVPTYARGVEWVDLRGILPAFVSSVIEDALPLFDRKLRGFASPDAVMTAPETRSSSPVRICRNESMQSWLSDDESRSGIGIYPAGEGPGYAGGIMSAAADGLRIAQNLALSLQRESQIKKAVIALRDGKVALLPTDTVYGLGVSVLHAQGPEGIFRIKKRSSSKPIAWLVGSVNDVSRYGSDVPDGVMALAKQFWPGALTIIVKASGSVPQPFQGEGGTIGLRMPDNETILHVIRLLGCPLATSSANYSGSPAPGDISQVDSGLLEEADVWVADYLNRSGVASTVIDCTGDEVRIIREGGVSVADICSIVDVKMHR